MIGMRKAYSNSKKGLAGARLLWLGFILSLTAIAINGAQAQDHQRPNNNNGDYYAIYDVYAGGIHGVEAILTIDNTPAQSKAESRYKLSLDAHTRGFLGRLVPWQGVFSSEGWRMKDGTYRTQHHQSVATWRGEKEIKDYRYRKDGSFVALTIDDHDKPPMIKEVEAGLTDNTSDVLSATLMMMEQIAAGRGCDGSSDIFDGKRRFGMVFREQADTIMKPSAFNVYSGPAVECTIEVQPKGGAWHKNPRGWLSIQEQGRERGTMPTIWFAKLSDDGPAYPVKVRIKTAYGTLFMHLSEYKNGDLIRLADKRAP